MPKRDSLSETQKLAELVYRAVVGSERIEDVAKDLGISRTTAQTLLRRAREKGLIETTSLLEPDDHDELAHRVLETWRHVGLRRVLVVPSLVDDRQVDASEYEAHIRRSLGALAARYLTSLPLMAGQILALTGGRSTMALVQRYRPPDGLVVRPLTAGGRWGPISHADASAAIQLLYAASSQSPSPHLVVSCPEIPAGRITKETLDRPEVQVVFGSHAQPPAVTVCGVGRIAYEPAATRLGLHPGTSGYVRYVAQCRFYDDKEMLQRLRKNPRLVHEPIDDDWYRDAHADLKAKGVVADLCRYPLKSDGSTVSGFVEDYCLATPPSLLKKWRDTDGTETIAIAATSAMGPALGSALNSQCLRTLVIDSSLALQLIIDERKRPDRYRHIPSVT